MTSDHSFTSAVSHAHGGPDALGVPRYDFSTNGNACGPCPVVVEALQVADASRYPDPSYTALRAALAQFHAVDAQRVVIGASASELIYRISAALQRTLPAACTVWTPAHCYGDYAGAAQAHGLGWARTIDQASLVWLCEPSSPLGQAAWQPSEAAVMLEKMAQLTPSAQQAQASMCVLDRAYEPLRLEGSSSLTGSAVQAVWQLWTPNKALGLTGVRAGYLLAPQFASAKVLQSIQSLAPSWPLGAHGASLLQAWTTAPVQQWLADSLPRLAAWKARQIALCAALGWHCAASQANYFTARLPSSAVSVQERLFRLRAKHIKLRDATSFRLPGHVRVSVQSPDAQDALALAWRQTS